MSGYECKSICVFCSSSEHAATPFFEASRRLGRQIGERGLELVFGGTKVGLMRELADSAKEAGARVVGVVPRKMVERGIAYDRADELIVTETLRERKAVMDTRADAFIAMPGGIGTLEELLEVLTLKQLQVHLKPIILLDIEQYYQPLAMLLNDMIEQKLAKPSMRELWYAAGDVDAAFDYLLRYKAPVIESKWL